MDLLKDRTTELEDQFRKLEQVAERRAVDEAIHADDLAAVMAVSPATMAAGWILLPGTPKSISAWISPACTEAQSQAPADGVVIYAQRKSDYGNLIIIDHGNGLTTRYGHLSRFQVRTARRCQKATLSVTSELPAEPPLRTFITKCGSNDRPVNPRNYLPRG